MLSDIEWTINPEDVEWEMDWGNKPETFSKTGKEKIFEPAIALAHLLLNEVVFINAFWWKYSKLGKHNENGFDIVPLEDPKWTKEESEYISVHVNCNDIFAWGCSDSEDLPKKGIESLYRMWWKDPEWGAAAWCIIQREQMPQKPVEDAIRKAGVWVLEELIKAKQ